VDSVYQHVLSWHDRCRSRASKLSVWRIHRRIGMSGGLFTNALLRGTGIAITPELTQRLPACIRSLHGARRAGPGVCPVPKSCWPT